MKRLIVLSMAYAFGMMAPATAQRVTVAPNESIAVIGNSLADRMQHHGWLETLVQARHPGHQLVFRNLGFAGDEITIRMRSDNFGSPDDWLTRVKADQVWAFFGLNESFKGAAGVETFRNDLDKWVKETLGKNYSGKAAPRLVLFSPIAAEKLADPNFADPTPINANLALYAKVIGEVATANKVPFVDLFTLTTELYGKGKGTFTFNGLHLTKEGDKLLAPEIFRELFGETAPGGDLAKLNGAVLEKNKEWHSRYRTVDGYNVYGGRSQLSYDGKKPDGTSHDKISNYDVMQREMAQRDVMTANRDKRVWAVAKGEELEVKDDNLPEPIIVGTNKPGDRPDLLHTFPSGEEVISKMKLAPGLKANLFADEAMFPDLVNPVQMAWDTKGRLWVAAWRDYPESRPVNSPGDCLMILEDTNGDGKADKSTNFMEKLNAPTGFQFYKDGVLLMQAPDLLFCRDTDGDGKADSVERVLMGLDSADSHHTTNAMCLEPGGATYLSDGVFHRTQVETHSGPVRNADGCIYRYEPSTGKFERYAAYGFANPHGRVFDEWGNDYITDATGNENYFGPGFSGFISEPNKHSGYKNFWSRPSRPCPATGIISSRHFPDDLNGNFINCNVISIHGIFNVKLSQDGSGMKGDTITHDWNGQKLTTIVECDPGEVPTFRPICVANGPDGALYFADWSNAIIGHMQHHLRDPNRDNKHGRIYRITYEGRPLITPPKIDGQPIEKLLDLLKEPENGTRELAKIELNKHDAAKVTEAAAQWVSRLDKAHPRYEHHRLEALWLYQWQNVVNIPLLKEVLASPEPRARAAAVRVLCYWRDRVPEKFELLRVAAEDQDPRVRLQAVRTCSFFSGEEAVAATDVALLALKQPLDYYLDYITKETLKQLEPVWRAAIAEGKPIATGNPKGIDYLLGSVDTAELLKMQRSPLVYQALVTRGGVPEVNRLEALVALAKENNSTVAAELVKVIEVSQGALASMTDLARLLPRQPAADLKALREKLVALTNSGSTEARATAMAALIVADGSADALWASSEKSPDAMLALLEGIQLLSDPALRGGSHEKLKALAVVIPDALTGGDAGSPSARYVRISLPRSGTLTLAEVQVFSAGKNIAGQGKAKQSTTGFGGEAARAIDGNTNGSYNSGTQTHTNENQENPWWELDLGSDQPLESLTIWNRTDEGGSYAARLEGFDVTVANSAGKVVFEKKGNPAPAESGTIAIGSDVKGTLHRAAIRALASTGQEPGEVFKILGTLIIQGKQRMTAMEAIRRIPGGSWDKDAAATVAKGIVAWAQTLDAESRTSEEFITATQLARDFSPALSEQERAAALAKLKELSVNVFLIKAVHEQLRFDVTNITVEAGKPFEIRFENPDALPHNLLVIPSGMIEAIGTASMTMPPTDLDEQGRAYVPKDFRNKVISGTKLLEAGQKATLKITAPQEPGEWEYVCTFPGHWTIMRGKITITAP